MGVNVEITKIDLNVEMQLLTGMIVSKPFIDRIMPVLDQDLLESSEVKLVMAWTLSYYKKYGKAPYLEIGNVFARKRRRLKEADADWIDAFLVRLSEDFALQGLNEDHLFDRVIEYFRRQKLEKLSHKIIELLEDGRDQEAEDLWINSTKTPTGIEDLGFDPFDMGTAVDLLAREDQFRTKMTLGIDCLDKMTGPLKSEWLIMFMGPMKRGKTSALTYIAVRALLLGLNVVFISLESGEGDSAIRFWANVGALTTYGEDKKTLEYPIFKNKRKGDVVNYEKRSRPKITSARVARSIKKFRKMNKGKLRVKVYPAFMAGIDDFERYLDALEAYEQFTPHVILVDYVGIMAAPAAYKGRDAYDFNSKRLKSLSQTRKALVFSGTQGTRATLDKLSMIESDVPEDIRQLAHVDLMYGLNQTPEEKDDGIMRLNVIAHRHRLVSKKWQAKVLQQPEAGQFYLDDIRVEAPKKKGKKYDEQGGKE